MNHEMKPVPRSAFRKSVKHLVIGVVGMICPGQSWWDPEKALIENCRGCGEPLTGDESLADGCKCNSGSGVNHGVVPAHVCTCIICDPEQTGSVRKRIKWREFL